ncbi:hypothetical protein [Sporanaerobacter sp.]|uniref:hypothetical protein n=1 Tax=Sporanaerobacter sp. TaxID=2010183 RepID=UPI003A101D49
MEKNNLNSYEEVFTKKIIKTGRWTLLGAIPLCMLPGIYLWIRYGAIPPVKTIFTAWFMIASIYGVEYFATPISYFPILGMSGTYMSFLSGNIANVRVPCAVVAQEVIGAEPGTNEGELVATLGIAGSIITNLIVVTIAALAGNVLISYFPPVVIKAFDYVLPAIFGALFSLFAVKYPKYGIFGMAISGFLVIVIGVLPTWLVVPLCSFSTIGFAIYSYKHKKVESVR